MLGFAVGANNVAGVTSRGIAACLQGGRASFATTGLWRSPWRYRPAYLSIGFQCVWHGLIVFRQHENEMRHGLLLGNGLQQRVCGFKRIAQAGFVGNALACDVEGRAVVGTGANEWQTGSDVDAMLYTEQLDRDQTLVVVLRDHDCGFLLPTTTSTFFTVGAVMRCAMPGTGICRANARTRPVDPANMRSGSANAWRTIMSMSCSVCASTITTACFRRQQPAVWRGCLPATQQYILVPYVREASNRTASRSHVHRI